MANIRKWLEEAESFYGERIEAIVVGKHDRERFGKAALPDENVILSREDGLKKLDYEYDNGHGGADCHPCYAWTASRVFFITEYDGATGMAYAPRSPTAIEPGFDGNDISMDEIDRIVAQRRAVS